MWSIRLWGASKALHTETLGEKFHEANAEDEILITETFAKSHGVFKAETRTAAGTTTIATPAPNGSIILSDLLISGEKQAGSSVEVRFTDGTNTVTIYLESQVDAPAGLAIPFAGRWQGWRDARIDMITVGTADATVALGYVKVNNGLTFAEWDAFR